MPQTPYYFIRTGTAGWFQSLDPKTGELQDGKFRLPKDIDRDSQIYDTEDQARTAYRTLQAVANSKPESEGQKAAAKMDAPTTVAPTGKVLIGKTIEITCAWKGCNAKRVIKPQDAFQVKFCVEHQKQNRREAQKAKRRARAAERKAVESAAA